MTKVVNKRKILTNKEEHKHEIQVDGEDPEAIMEVWIREITYLDVQKAAQTMFVVTEDGVSLDLQAYWEYAFTNWVVGTNPELSVEEMRRLNAYAGEQLASLLPKPDELAEAMQGGFTKASN
jgi:hypothetical protein